MLATRPVSRILWPALRRADGHSSRRRIATPLISDLPGSCGAPSRHAIGISAVLLPYLALLRVGFALPSPLLPRRCALTAPFHLFLSGLRNAACAAASPSRPAQAGQLSPSAHSARFLAEEVVCFLWHWPSIALYGNGPGVTWHTALWSSDFPLPAARSLRNSASTQRAATIRSSHYQKHYRGCCSALGGLLAWSGYAKAH
jgi:hypothetical protein